MALDQRFQLVLVAIQLMDLGEQLLFIRRFVWVRGTLFIAVHLKMVAAQFSVRIFGLGCLAGTQINVGAFLILERKEAACAAPAPGQIRVSILVVRGWLIGRRGWFLRGAELRRRRCPGSRSTNAWSLPPRINRPARSSKPPIQSSKCVPFSVRS